MTNKMTDSQLGPDPNDAESRQPTVLVIEDYEPLRLSMTALLTRKGYLVLTASTGHDALATLRCPFAPIDVVLLDVRLPDVSGIAICARLRELYPSLPVIICTGEATPEEVSELLKLGAHRFFQKPISPDELLATVEAALP